MTKKVLIIDDHKSWLNVLKTILRQSGFEVLVADQSARGVSMAQSDSPDIILLDIMMPDMDGFEACRQIRATAGLSHTPIIILSARFGQRDQELALQAGANDYLIKPVHPVTLVNRMRELLGMQAG